MHRDTVIGIVGVFILVAAMVGVFSYERGQAANILGDGALLLTNLTGPALEGTADVGAEATDTLSIAQANLTKITFTLTWSAGQTSENTVELLIAPANGTGLTEGVSAGPESDGEITVDLLVPNAEPTSGPLTTGVGDYQVTVRFVSASANGAPVGVPGGTPLTDGSITWNLETTLTAYEPVDVSAGDDS